MQCGLKQIDCQLDKKKGCNKSVSHLTFTGKMWDVQQEGKVQNGKGCCGMPCSPAVPVLLMAGDWILTSTAVPMKVRKKLLPEYFTVGKGRGEFIACMEGIARKKGRKRKNNTHYLWVFSRVAQVAGELSESKAKVISDCDNGETVGQEEKCILS